MILKMYFCGIKTHIQKNYMCLYFRKIKEDSKILCNTKRHSLFHQILFFLQTMAITSNLTVNMDSPYLKNIQKLVLHLILVVKLPDIWYFHVPVAAILDCSRSGHQRHSPTRLRCFLESFYPYLSPYQISKTCHQVHDSTFIWHIPPLLV